MKVEMILSNGFEPDMRVYREAKALANKGYIVTIHCLDRNCNLIQKETLDKINIKRYRVGKIKSGNIISVGIGLFKFYNQVQKKILQENKRNKIDIVHCHDFDTMKVGIYLKKRLKIKLVYDIHDLYESFLENNKILQKIIRNIDIMYCKKADHLIIVNDEFKNKKQIKGKRTTTIMNTPEETKIEIRPIKSDYFYAGNLTQARNMEFIFEANKKLKHKIIIAGEGPLLRQYKQKYENEYNLFLGKISTEEVELKTSETKIIIAPYDPKYPNNKLATPNKLFEAMKYGKPVLVSKNTVMAKIVEKEKCGETFTYGSKKEFIEKTNKINENYKQYSKKSKELFSTKYSWNIMEARLLDMYIELLK